MTVSQQWLLLLFFLPSARAHARVQAWRRLQRVGAVSLRNAAWVLPHSDEAREDLEWIRNEIVAGGGEATVLVARAPDQDAHDDIVNTFRAARSQDFKALAEAATGLLRRTMGKNARDSRSLTQGLRRLRERFDETVRRDFFETPERKTVAALLAQFDQARGRNNDMPPAASSVKTRDFHNKVWLTRPRPGVDRMSSAWLIRRFIDPKARFVFTDSAKTPGAIPFDTYNAEFGHHGAHCTFETFCRRFGIADRSVQRIGRIVHDLDLKERTYAEADTDTVGRLVEGLRRAHEDDAVLLQSGIEMFEALYQSTAAATLPAHVTRKPRSGRRTPKPSRLRTNRS
jgi:hypothetical protein